MALLGMPGLTSLPALALADTLKAELARHAQQHVLIKSGTALAAEVTADLGYTTYEAADFCGVSYGKFRRLAIKLGVNKHRIRPLPQ
jgi:hypothetical protein